jgi:Secretion system C-terminal sorting domain
LVDVGLTIASPNSQNIPNNRDVLVHDCTFSFTDWMGWFTLPTGTACRFVNLMQRVHFERNQINGVSNGTLWENHTGIELRNSSIGILGGRLHNLRVGVSAEKEDNNNVYLRETEISGCETGVDIVGGEYSSFSNLPYGFISMICTQLVDNQTGIRGLKASLGINTGNNTFRTATDGLLFDICGSRNDDLIPANFNFWDGGFGAMRFNIISGDICSRGERLRLRQCSEYQSEPTNCFPPIGSCCNIISTTSDGEGVGTGTVIQCLVAQNNSQKQLSNAEKMADEKDNAETTKASNEKWVIFPNPANESVQLVMDNGNYHLRVLNTVGQTIFDKNTEGSLSVDVSTWTNGMYLFEVTDKVTKKQQRRKIIVQH